MIVVNDVSDHRIGFNSNDNAVTVITTEGEDRIDIGSKSEIARTIIDRIARAIERRSSHRGVSTKHVNDSGVASG
jgi:phosphopantothenoylcysteine decarboxylase / phosphopantothenate---cysteine ligase